MDNNLHTPLEGKTLFITLRLTPVRLVHLIVIINLNMFVVDLVWIKRFLSYLIVT